LIFFIFRVPLFSPDEQQVLTEATDQFAQGKPFVGRDMVWGARLVDCKEELEELRS
jgi:hypothetical protein